MQVKQRKWRRMLPRSSPRAVVRLGRQASGVALHAGCPCAGVDNQAP